MIYNKFFFFYICLTSFFSGLFSLFLYSLSFDFMIFHEADHLIQIVSNTASNLVIGDSSAIKPIVAKRGQCPSRYLGNFCLCKVLGFLLHRVWPPYEIEFNSY